jgi:hypothetical protein
MPTLGFGRFRSERRVPWKNESRPCCAGLRKPGGDGSWNSRRSTRASASGQRRQRSQASSRLFLSACPASCVQKSGAAAQSFPEQSDARHQRMGQASWVGPLESVAMLRDGVLRNLVSRGDLPRSAASDSWRSLRYAQVPPVDYRDKPPSNETGSGFNRRNREWRLTLERRFGRCRRAGCRPRWRATAPRGQWGGHGCSASTATAAIVAGRGPRRRPRRRSGRGKSRGC